MQQHLSKFFPKSNNVVSFKKGSTVVLKGSPLEHAFIINQGKLALTTENNFANLSSDKKNYVELEKGEIFGDVLLLTGYSNPMNCLALEDSELIVISKDQLQDRIKRSDTFIQLLIEILSKRITYFISIHKEDSENKLAELAKGFPWYGKDLGDTAKLQSSRMKLKVESDIYKAIEQDLFSCEYQVITCLKTRQIKGFESLIRWENIAGSRVPPEIFIEIAEETSLIVPVSYWSIERSLSDFSSILSNHELSSRTELKDMFISLNISAQVFSHKDFISRLSELCQKYNVAPSNVKLELTERVFMQDQKSVDIITQLRTAGFMISIEMILEPGSLAFLPDSHRCRFDKNRHVLYKKNFRKR